MRIIVTGHTAEGKSTVISDGQPDHFLVHPRSEDLLSTEVIQVHDIPSPPGELESNSALLWSTPGGGPVLDIPEGAPAPPAFIDLEPGATRWVLLRYGPFAYASPHRTNTLDYDLIISGSGELILDTCTVPVSAGDMVVIAGVNHGWRAGPNGFCANIAMTGTRP